MLKLKLCNYVAIELFPFALIDLLDGERDDVYADRALLDGYGVTMEIAGASQTSRIITLNGTAPEGVTPTAFEEVH